MDRTPGNKIELPIPTAAAAESSLSSASPPWMELPEDVTANILQRLDIVEILESAEKVCRTWRKVCLDPAMWRVIHLKNRDGFDKKFDLICRCAVDHSQGQLIDLNIAGFGDDELLKNIADRSSHLQRLTLADSEISNSALTESVKNLPELEELHLIMIPLIQNEDVETIGISCPMLKAFTLNDWSEHLEYEELNEGDYYNDHGLAIAKTMPNLCHLQLVAIRMTNKGLEAVLDGCPQLESLDLRQCFGLDLQGDLGKRCHEQIKDLRLPSDSISDLEWPVKPSDDSSWDDSQSSYSGISNFSDFAYEHYDTFDDFEFEFGDDIF